MAGGCRAAGHLRQCKGAPTKSAEAAYADFGAP